jgi:hypothetical protein
MGSGTKDPCIHMGRSGDSHHAEFPSAVRFVARNKGPGSMHSHGNFISQEEPFITPNFLHLYLKKDHRKKRGFGQGRCSIVWFS